MSRIRPVLLMIALLALSTSCYREQDVPLDKPPDGSDTDTDSDTDADTDTDTDTDTVTDTDSDTDTDTYLGPCPYDCMSEILCELIGGTVHDEYEPCSDLHVCCEELDTDTDTACPEVCNAGCVDDVCFIEDPGAFSVECPGGWMCHLTCTFAGACNGGLDCDGNDQCTVECLVTDACLGGVDCVNTNCTVTCAAQWACPSSIYCDGPEHTCQIFCLAENACAPIDCGTGACVVDCTASIHACGGVVECDEACACDVYCDPFCIAPASCPEGCNALDSNGCTSAIDGCDSC